MVLAREWRRRLYASMSLSVILPVALVLSVALLALNAGFSGLSSLGQALSGPSPSAVRGPSLGSAAGGNLGGAGPAGRSTQSLLAAASPTNSRAGGRSTPGSGLQTHRSGSPGVGAGGGGGSASHHAGAGGNPGSPPGPSHQPGGSGSSPLGPVVRTVTSVTSRLPNPVGPVATGVANKAGSTVSKILKHLTGSLP